MLSCVAGIDYFLLVLGIRIQSSGHKYLLLWWQFYLPCTTESIVQVDKVYEHFNIWDKRRFSMILLQKILWRLNRINWFIWRKDRESILLQLTFPFLFTCNCGMLPKFFELFDNFSRCRVFPSYRLKKKKMKNGQSVLSNTNCNHSSSHTLTI